MLLTLLCAVITTALSAASPAVGDTLRYEYKGNNLYYKITKLNPSGNEVMIVSDGTNSGYPYDWKEANKPSGALVIPNTIKDADENEYKVTDIAQYAFRGGADKLTSIDLSENTYITCISAHAFNGCNNVTSITLSDYITSILGYALRGCKLTSIDLKNVTKIEMVNFSDCMIDSVHIPSSLTTLESQTYLFDHATKITIGENNAKFAVVGNVLYNKELTKIISLPLGLTSGELHIVPTATSALFRAMEGCGATIYFHSQVKPDYGPDYRNSPAGDVIVRCQDYDFYTSGNFVGGANSDFAEIKSLTAKLLHDIDVKAVNGTVVFNDTTNCNHVKVTITPDEGCVFLGWADGNNDNPRVFTVVSDTTVIANIKKPIEVGGTFRANTVEGVSVLYKVLTKEPGNMTVQVGERNGFVGADYAQAIDKTYNGPITIAETVNYFDETYTVVALGSGAFSLCKITSLTLPNTVQKLEQNSIYECTNLTTVNLPEGITTIPRYNLSYMNQLKSITLPTTLKYICSGSLNNNTQMATIVNWNPSQYERLGNNIGSMDTKFFSAMPLDSYNVLYTGDIVLRQNVPAGKDTLIIKDGTRLICGDLSGDETLTTIVLPASLEAIGDKSFYGMPNLTSCIINATQPVEVYVARDSQDPTKTTTAEKLKNGSTPEIATVKFYVPKTAVTAYRESATWAGMDIRPIGGWTITFVDHDGETTQQVEQGEMPTAPTPAVYYTAEHMYVFDHWNVSLVPATADATYEAVYAAQDLPKYYVCFYATQADALAQTNRILRVEKSHGTSAVDNGVVAAAKLDPRACEMVTEWDGGDLSNVTSELHVWPIWGTGQFTVVFYVEATAVKTINNVECGDLIEAPTDFAIPAGKIFVGWDSDAWQNTDALSGNLDIHAVLQDDPSGLGNVQSATIPCSKIILDGQLYIQRGDELFNAQGTKVK